MFNLHESEQILLILHRHWFVFALHIAMFLFLTLLPLPLLFIIPFEPVGALLFWFLTVIYWLMVFGILLIVWIEYWLDMWIITTERIIDVEQRSFFSREVSEFLLSRVQDVSVEIPNLTATFFHYGNIVVQTAGEKSFTIRDVPEVDRAKEIILQQSLRLQKK